MSLLLGWVLGHVVECLPSMQRPWLNPHNCKKKKKKKSMQSLLLFNNRKAKIFRRLNNLAMSSDNVLKISSFQKVFETTWKRSYLEVQIN
jgi:hypothetical protein